MHNLPSFFKYSNIFFILYFKRLVLIVIILFGSFVSIPCMSRDLSEIKNSGEFRVALMNPKFGSYSKELNEEMNALLKKYIEQEFKNFTGKNIRLKILYQNSLNDFWVNNNGKIDQEDDDYTPVLFSKVDAYLEPMSESTWRNKRAYPVFYMDSYRSFICNFKTSFERSITKILKDASVKFVSVKGSIFDVFLKDMNIPDQRIIVEHSDIGVENTLVNGKNKLCSVGNSPVIVKALKFNNIYFITDINGKKSPLAWWTKYEDEELQNFLERISNSIKLTDDFDKIFLRSIGLRYSLYEFMMDEVGTP